MKKHYYLYVHFIFVGSLLFLLCKAKKFCPVDIQPFCGIGLAIAIILVAIGCAFGFLSCHEEEGEISKRPPTKKRRFVLGECQWQKLGLMYVFITLIMYYGSFAMTPDHLDLRSIFVPGAIVSGMLGVCFLIVSRYFSYRALRE